MVQGITKRKNIPTIVSICYLFTGLLIDFVDQRGFVSASCLIAQAKSPNPANSNIIIIVAVIGSLRSAEFGMCYMFFGLLI